MSKIHSFAFLVCDRNSGCTLVKKKILTFICIVKSQHTLILTEDNLLRFFIDYQNNFTFFGHR